MTNQPKDPMKLRGAECFAYALTHRGYKIFIDGWESKKWIETTSSLYWHDSDNNQSLISEYCPDPDWQPYIEPKKEPELVTWYRPLIIWHISEKSPMKEACREFVRNKQDILRAIDDNCKVLEWEDRQFPATWEECESE